MAAWSDTLLGSTVFRIAGRLVLAVGTSVGIGVQTVTADITCTGRTGPVMRVNGGGADRNLDLYATDAKGEVKLIINSGTTNNLVVRYGSGPTTLVTLLPGEWAIVFSADGTTWYFCGMQAAGVTGVASTWTALQTFGAGLAVKDSVFTVYDDGDATKIAKFQASGITAGNTRTLTVPDASGTLALLSLAQTWSAKQTLGDASLGGTVDSPMTAAQDVSTGNTITLPTTGLNKALDASAGAASGVILTAGTVAGQLLVLHNVHATNAITFAAAGTSNVASGTSCQIPALTGKLFTWDATASRWYAVG